MNGTLITLTGPRRSIDLRVPRDVPINRLLPVLLDICGPQTLYIDRAEVSKWGLGTAGAHEPLVATSSLEENCILDGATLVLETMSEWKRQSESKALFTSLRPSSS